MCDLKCSILIYLYFFTKKSFLRTFMLTVLTILSGAEFMNSDIIISDKLQK